MLQQAKKPFFINVVAKSRAINVLSRNEMTNKKNISITVRICLGKREFA